MAIKKPRPEAGLIMSCGYLESLGINHNCKDIAGIISPDIKKRGHFWPRLKYDLGEIIKPNYFS